MDNSPHTSSFINANGIRLHYLDWGGPGEVLLFLAGLGCNAHVYDHFATRFTDNFRVMALTRRGHGESDHPETGYDIEHLTEDIRQFLDCLDIPRVILAGHSLAGVELSHFAALYPQRVLRLIFLDAAYDRSAPSCREMEAKYPFKGIRPPGANVDYYSPEEYFAGMKRDWPSMAVVWDEAMETQGRLEITQDADGKVIDKLTDQIGAAFMEMSHSYSPEDAKITAPTLAFFTTGNGPYYSCAEWMTNEQRARVAEFYETVHRDWVRENIEAFRRNAPHACIVELPEGHHYCFIKSEQKVYDEMRKFLDL